MAAKNRTTRDLIFDVIRDNADVTETRIMEITGLSTSRVTPNRIRLWTAGLVEPDCEVGWRDALANRPKAVRWRVVDDPTRRREVAARAATRRARNAEPTAEQRAKRIVEALQDPTVNRLVLQMTKDGPGSRRAIRYAEKMRKQRHDDARQQAKQAEHDKLANAAFLRMLANLWDARGAVAAADKHLIDERARVASGEPRRISDGDWLVALRDVRIIIASFGTMWKNVRDLGDPHAPCPACGAPQSVEARQLGEAFIDADAEDIVDAEVVEDGFDDAEIGTS